MTSGPNEKRDWRISVILLAIWAVAMYLVWKQQSGIPLSMIATATVFFVFLVPAMNDLVRSIERRVFGDDADLQEDNKQN
jgi:hypothetical protein